MIYAGQLVLNVIAGESKTGLAWNLVVCDPFHVTLDSGFYGLSQV